MFSSYYQKIIVFLILLFSSITTLPSWGMSKMSISESRNSQDGVFLPRRGFNGFSQRYGVAPSRRSTPFRRGSCLAPQAEMMALFPSEDVITESNDQETLGKDRTWFTNEAYPTLYFYVPQNSPLTAEVVLEDSDRNIVYSAIVRLPNQDVSATNPRPQGFIGIDFSDKAKELNIPPLEPMKTYLWEVQLICNNLDYSGNPLVNGWITRLDQDESEQINTLISQENYREIPWIYARNGILYSTLNSLAHNYLVDPDAQADWQIFLDSIGYKRIANYPFLGMAEVEKIFLEGLPDLEF